MKSWSWMINGACNINWGYIKLALGYHDTIFLFLVLERAQNDNFIVFLCNLEREKKSNDLLQDDRHKLPLRRIKPSHIYLQNRDWFENPLKIFKTPLSACPHQLRGRDLNDLFELLRRPRNHLECKLYVTIENRKYWKGTSTNLTITTFLCLASDDAGIMTFFKEIFQDLYAMWSSVEVEFALQNINWNTKYGK